MRLTTPVVNMNGNTKQTLVEDAMRIANALKAVEQAFRASDLLHGRNYQTAGGETRERAEMEQRKHFQWIHERAIEYQQLAIDINEQGK